MRLPNRKNSFNFKNFENFFCSIIFIQVFPVAVPLIAEFFYSNDVKRNSFDLCLSIFFFSSSIITNKRLAFSLSILMGVLLAFSYGRFKLDSAFPIFYKWETYIFLLSSLFQILERWDRHVKSNELFFNFN